MVLCDIISVLSILVASLSFIVVVMMGSQVYSIYHVKNVARKEAIDVARKLIEVEVEKLYAKYQSNEATQKEMELKIYERLEVIVGNAVKSLHFSTFYTSSTMAMMCLKNKYYGWYVSLMVEAVKSAVLIKCNHDFSLEVFISKINEVFDIEGISMNAHEKDRALVLLHKMIDSGHTCEGINKLINNILTIKTD